MICSLSFFFIITLEFINVSPYLVIKKIGKLHAITLSYLSGTLEQHNHLNWFLLISTFYVKNISKKEESLSISPSASPRIYDRCHRRARAAHYLRDTPIDHLAIDSRPTLVVRKKWENDGFVSSHVRVWKSCLLKL